jgi:CAAX protease family protein
MKKALLTIAALLALAAVADSLVLARLRTDPWGVGAVLGALALELGVFVGLTDAHFVRRLRHWAVGSPLAAVGLPLLLLVPYLLYALITHTFVLKAALKLAVYVTVPAALVLPDRLHHAERVGWRDLVAMLALAVPISAGWLSGIWTWPVELYFFIPLTAVCTGGYAFMVVRNLEDVGYRLLWRKQDLVHGVGNFVAFSLLGIPLGYALHFISFHPHGVSLASFVGQFLGIYLTIAIPEEFLFRGVLQNFLEKSIHAGPPGRYALIIASVVFGASHFHHPPVPNWRYCIMATLAGLFYGNAYRNRRRISASALTHALVDTLWHFWF